MKKFECKKCGDCCGPVPFPIKMFNRFKHLAQREIIELIPVEEIKMVIPKTKTGDCIFLTNEKLCAIYNNRLKVCRQQGKIVELPCPHNDLHKDSPYPEIYAKKIEEAMKVA